MPPSINRLSYQVAIQGIPIFNLLPRFKHQGGQKTSVNAGLKLHQRSERKYIS